MPSIPGRTSKSQRSKRRKLWAVSGLVVSAAGGVAAVVFRRRSQPEADGDAGPDAETPGTAADPPSAAVPG